MFWRRTLPHWVPSEATVFVTWRLAGTVYQPPADLRLRDPNPGRSFVLQDRELDRPGVGPHWLRDPRVAAVVAEALVHGDRVRHAYRLVAWVIMPNHVHVVWQPLQELPEIFRWVKTATAVRANRILGVSGAPFWQREYFDRWVRSEKELMAAIRYVERNPVTAGLAAAPEQWRWSSAWEETGGKTAGATA
jgi:putative transposase